MRFVLSILTTKHCVTYRPTTLYDRQACVLEIVVDEPLMAHVLCSGLYNVTTYLHTVVYLRIRMWRFAPSLKCATEHRNWHLPTVGSWEQSLCIMFMFL